MTVSIITLFPEMFSGPFSSSIIKRAQEKSIVSIHLIHIRKFADDRYKTVDDHPYGGGAGMVLKVDVVDRAIRHAKQHVPQGNNHAILLSPQGAPLAQSVVKRLCTIDHLILVCGHYEGVDERIRSLVDEEISIGDYVLTGGEIPAMVLTDAVIRLIPGVLKKDEATRFESFESNLLEYPHFTRPPDYEGMKVPDVLINGNHAKITEWRTAQAIERTRIRRPDLLKKRTTPNR